MAWAAKGMQLAALRAWWRSARLACFLIAVGAVEMI